MEITVKSYAELTRDELFAILHARVAVFVVEQQCPYQEVDAQDREALHVCLWEDGELVAYLRAFVRDEQTAQIGRVLTLRRGCGYGTPVLRAGIRAARERLGRQKIYIEAQTYAVGFYEKEGFVTCSAEFLEDGIPHVQMLLQ